MNNLSVTWQNLPAPPVNKFGWPWLDIEQCLKETLDNFKYPKITIITPSYNQEQFIEETIRSVLLQNYPNLEYIIIDGGSTDKSVEIIRKYEKYITCWVSEKDRGQSHAINKGFAKSSGDILCWINSDDLLKPGALEFVARSFPDISIPAWLIGSSEIIDSASKLIKLRTPENTTFERVLMWNDNWFPQQSTFWTRPMWNAVSKLDESLHYAMDFALWLNMFEVAKPLLTKELLSSYRYQENAKCLTQPSKALEEVIATLWQYFKEAPKNPKVRLSLLQAITKLTLTQRLNLLRETKLFKKTKKVYKAFIA
ncbi:MAG: glycosyltransferase [Ferruginibacter sp.]|nr:glycosyltransferase [Ferruginibacter sp.]